MKSLLTQQPWLHDPLVHEIPWRNTHEEEISDLIKSKKLSFGIFKHDGAITPHPPVRRAIEMMIKTIEKLGYKTIEWNPPSHARGVELYGKSMVYDGGLDVHSALGLSGEPIASQVSALYRMKPFEQATASHICATNVAKREYQKEYMEYWNSTAMLTGTGRPVDAIIAPVAPFAAARRERYKYYGYSSIFNTLDYTSCVIPMTNVDKSVDVVDKDFKALNSLDKEIAGDCKFLHDT